MSQPGGPVPLLDVFGGDLRCYLRTGDQVFETYETKWRGIEAMLPTLQLLDGIEPG